MCLSTCESLRYDRASGQWTCALSSTAPRPSAMEVTIVESDDSLGGKQIRKCNAFGILGGRFVRIPCNVAKPILLFRDYKIPDSE